VETTLMFWIWVGATAVFVVGEIFTAGFFLLPFGVGTGVAAVITLVGGPSWLQWLGFVVTSAIMVFFSRRFAERFAKEPPEKVGVDRLIGMTALVIEPIDPVSDSGRVRVKKDEWRATSVDNKRVEKDTEVRVVRIEGAHLVVERTKE